MARKPSRSTTKALAPLAEANDRLQLLEQSGLSRRRRAELLAKAVSLLESLLANPEVDPFARIAAAKTIIRDVAGVQPSKTAATLTGSQAPVIINIGDAPPEPSRKPRPVSVSQGGDIITVEPNAPYGAGLDHSPAASSPPPRA